MSSEYQPPTEESRDHLYLMRNQAIDMEDLDEATYHQNQIDTFDYTQQTESED